MRKSNSTRFILILFCFNAALACAQSRGTPEQCTSGYLASVRKQPPLALAFLREMPKGGDLHNHLGGAIYAEDLIDFAAQDKVCLNRAGLSLVAGPCDSSCDRESSKPEVACDYRDPDFYNSIIDAWSMRNWKRGRESGHDHFFATFAKFGLARNGHSGEAIALAMERAAADHLQYLELFMRT